MKPSHLLLVALFGICCHYVGGLFIPITTGTTAGTTISVTTTAGGIAAGAAVAAAGIAGLGIAALVLSQGGDDDQGYGYGHGGGGGGGGHGHRYGHGGGGGGGGHGHRGGGGRGHKHGGGGGGGYGHGHGGGGGGGGHGHGHGGGGGGGGHGHGGGGGGGHGHGGGGGGGGYHRHRRDVSEEKLEEIFAFVARVDTNACGMKLVCDLYQKPRSSLSKKEFAIMQLIGDNPKPVAMDKINEPRSAYQSAAILGMRGEKCADLYYACPLSGKKIHLYLESLQAEERNPVDFKF